MNESLVSVIVPVYNIQEYLEECLESILQQTYENLEIILVDDGSTDGSTEICDAYLEKDVRVKVIHQENAGAANARKNGIMAATAPYICFVDADDTVDAEMIQYFIENIKDADILTSGCRRGEADGTITERYDSFDEGIYNTKSEMHYIINNMLLFHGRIEDGILPYLVGKLYKTFLLRDVVKGIDERIGYDEDRELLLRYLIRCKSIVIKKICFYHYRYRSVSMAHAPNPHYLQDLNYFYNSLKTVFLSCPSKDSLIKQLERFMMSRALISPKIMGFELNAQCIRYIFPFYNLLNNKKIILYGAGAVGNNYYRQMKADNNLDIVLWVDKRWKEYQNSDRKIESVNRIADVAFDVIIIAVKKESIAFCIKKDLKEMGIPSERLLWKEPIETLI